MRGAFWWVDRYRQSNAYKYLTLAEQGAFRNLCDELWLCGGTLPDDDRILGNLCGDGREWAKVKKAVMAKFYRVPDGWRNKTHDEVSAESQRRADKQARYRARVGNKDGNEAGNGGGNEPVPDAVTEPPLRSPFNNTQEPDPISGEGRARAKPTEGKLLEDIACPQCSVSGYLVQTPPRNGNPPQFWCRRPSGGCGFSVPIEFAPEIIAQMTPGGRKVVEGQLPKEPRTRAEKTEDAIDEGFRRVRERGVILAKSGGAA